MSFPTKLPPDPQHAVIKKIYPWDEYNKTLVMQWLYLQAKETGFVGSFEDFKLRFGIYVQGLDEEGVHYLMEAYEGSYHVTPMLETAQILFTKNKALNDNIIIDPVPPEYVVKRPTYIGLTDVVPQRYFGVTLRTKNTIIDTDIVVEPIPYREESNEYGTTAIIG